MILALDTSGGELLVAMVDPGGEAARLVTGAAVPGRRHQSNVIEVIQEVAAAGVGLEQVTALAVAHGPGSHTGLRVGLSTVSGMAFARRLPIYPLSSLAVAAHRAEVDQGVVLAAVVAGRGRTHLQAFEAAGDNRTPRGERVCVDLGQPAHDPAHPAARLSGEPELMETAAQLGGWELAPVRPGAEALAAAAVQAFRGDVALNYDQLTGDYGEQVTAS